MKNKKLLGVLGVAALLLAGNFAMQEKEVVEAAGQPETLYLTPNTNWKKDGARFAAYFFGNGETWVSMTDNEGGKADGIYEVKVPTTKVYPSVIFCRMNPGASANNWNNKWNQTSDLTIPTNGTNHYTVSEGVWDKGAGTWSVYTQAGEEVDPSLDLLSILSTYTNEGYYVRETEIFINKQGVEADLAAKYNNKEYKNLFHAEATDLVRTTYFEGNQLWMTNESGVNSGYGTTSDGKMNHFKYENGVKKVDYTVANSTGMEDWYTTLKDIVVNEEQKWKKEGEKYSSSDLTVIGWFKDFTAPCFVGFEDVPNYIQFSHVEVEIVNKKLELRLYVKSTDSGKVTTEDCLFSCAKISNMQSHTLPGGWPNSEWDSVGTPFHVTDLGTNLLVRELELTAKTYEFKVFSDDWRGCNKTIDGDKGCMDEAFTLTQNANCKLTVKTAGRYKFTYNVEKDTLSITKI